MLLSWVHSQVLDILLGHNDALFQRAQLKALVSIHSQKDLQMKDQGSDSSIEPDTNVPSDSIEQNLSDKEISALCWASLSGSILAVGYLDGDILF
ncbi:hypothetical protein S83_062722 [Arachis hypogaea]